MNILVTTAENDVLSNVDVKEYTTKKLTIFS